MGSFEDGIEQLRAARVALEREASPALGRYLEAQQLGAPSFMPGTRARDSVTGEEVEIVGSTRVLVAPKAAG